MDTNGLCAKKTTLECQQTKLAAEPIWHTLHRTVQYVWSVKLHVSL